MKIAGIHIVEAESGLSLYSKSTENLIQPDLFSAFLIALKGFFSDFSLGGLSNFASESYIIYLASVNKVLTVLIVEKAFKSDKYFNLAYEISIQFYQKYISIIDSNYKLVNKDEIHFDDILYKLLDFIDENEKDGQELI